MYCIASAAHSFFRRLKIHNMAPRLRRGSWTKGRLAPDHARLRRAHAMAIFKQGHVLARDIAPLYAIGGGVLCLGRRLPVLAPLSAGRNCGHLPSENGGDESETQPLRVIIVFPITVLATERWR